MTDQTLAVIGWTLACSVAFGGILALLWRVLT